MANKVEVKELLDAGVHFGHLTRRWNPNMAPYIYMERNGIHIINLYKSAAKMQEAAKAMSKIAASGRKILFVATKKQAKEIVAEEAEKADMPYITERWPGGMLTNFVTIRRAVKKMDSVDRMKKDGRFDTLSKKERLQVNRMRAKLEKQLGSITEMTRLPGALFIVDILRENIAVKEAQRLNIPIFAMVDTNSDPREVDYVIPSNDDASKSIKKVVSYLSDSIVEGLDAREKDLEAKRKEKEEAKAQKAAEKEKAAKEKAEKEKAEKEAKVKEEKSEGKKSDDKADTSKPARPAGGSSATKAKDSKKEKASEKKETKSKASADKSDSKKAEKKTSKPTEKSDSAEGKADKKAASKAKTEKKAEVPSKDAEDKKAMKEAKEDTKLESKKETLEKATDDKSDKKED